MAVSGSFQTQSKAPIGHGLGILSIFIFAAGFPAAEHLLQIWDPTFLITVRISLVVLAALVAWVLLEGAAAVCGANWRQGISIGFLGFGASTYLLLVGQYLSDPVTAALITTTLPVMGVALEVCFDGRRLTRRFAFSVGLIVLGGIVAIGQDLGEAGFGLGALAVFVATVLFTIASRQSVKGLSDHSTLAQTTLTFAGGMIFCGLSYDAARAFGDVQAPSLELTSTDWSAFLLYSLGAMGVSQFLWLASVKHLGIGLAGFHLNGAPFYVMIILVAMGGSWEIAQVIGAAILLVGVILAQLDENKVAAGPKHTRV